MRISSPLALKIPAVLVCSALARTDHAGWAVGSLIMAEKVLQAEIGLEKPSWLDTDWYEKNVVGHL
ncbi:hypothetical protein D3C86_2199230 [compost metagenome]